MKHLLTRTAVALLLAALLVTVAGCSKLTTENYDQLKIGMSYDQVIALLGKADECSGAIGIKNCRWGNDKKNIVVNFAGDKVVLFAGKGL